MTFGPIGRGQGWAVTSGHRASESQRKDTPHDGASRHQRIWPDRPQLLPGGRRQRNADIEFVAVNDLGSIETMAHLLKYDSVLGILPYDVKATEHGITVDGDELSVLAERDPKNLPWSDLGVDVVIECTGFFTKRDTAAAHLEAGAPLVIVSAPCDAADATFVYGVNHKDFDFATQKVISNASCTTNCFVPMVKVLDDNFGVEQGLMQTVHAYTGDQMLVDGPHKDLRRGARRGDQHRARPAPARRGRRASCWSHEGQARWHVAARAGARPADRRLHRQPDDRGVGRADQHRVQEGGRERAR